MNNSIKQLRENEYEDAFNLFEITSRAGENIGIGEIPTLKFLRIMMQKAEAVGLYHDKKVLESVVLVKPYHVVRHVSPVVCQILVATRQHPISECHLRHLFRVGCELAVRQDCGGYTGCIVEVFAYCLKHLQVLREEGFHVTCTVPHAGLLSGHEGYVMSYCLYKELRASDSSSYTKNMVIKRFHHDTTSADFKLNLLTCTEVFPKHHTFSDELKVTIRHLREEEVQNYFQAFTEAVDSGYGINEIPTYEIFLRNRIDNFYNFVVENEENKDAIAYYNVGPSRSTRCRTKNILSTSNLVILPKYRGKHLAREIMIMIGYTTALIGYRAIAGTTAITNIRILKGSNMDGRFIQGVIPKGIYLTKTGWTDILLTGGNIPAGIAKSNL